MSMNELLAQYYDTLGEKTASAQQAATPTSEDLEKQAQYELFVKIASSNGIDLTKMSDEQVNELYVRTFAKTAGEMPPQFMNAKKDGDKDDDKKKREEAEKEHAEKKAAATRWQEADFFGRQAAHAYVDELKKIASATAAVSSETTEVAATTPAPVTKQASAIDSLAAKRSVQMIEEYNKTASTKFDGNEAAARVNAVVFTLGLRDSEKIASAANLDAAVEVRALEILEAAGYPVEWKT